MHKKNRRKALEDYNSKKVNRIIAARALNEGVNLTEVHFAIAVTANSSIKDLIQEGGRICRIDEKEKQAIYIRLYLIV